MCPDISAAGRPGGAEANRRTRAVKCCAPDALGRSVYVPGSRVQSDPIEFVVNGPVVLSTPKTGVVTDGIRRIPAPCPFEVRG